MIILQQKSREQSAKIKNKGGDPTKKSAQRYGKTAKGQDRKPSMEKTKKPQKPKMTPARYDPGLLLLSG